MTTFVVRFSSNSYTNDGFSKMQKWLFRENYSVKINEPEEEYGITTLTATSLDGRISIVASKDLAVCAIVICSLDRINVNSIRKFLFEEVELDWKFVGELHHCRRHFELHGTDVKATVTTGTSERQKKDNLLPVTFYWFRLARKLIGKAYLRYFNLEIGECAPMIELFEVREKYRRKGIGTMMLRTIELDAFNQGFDRIWAIDVRSYEFFKKAGYKFNWDVCVKRFDEHKP